MDDLLHDELQALVHDSLPQLVHALYKKFEQQRDHEVNEEKSTRAQSRSLETCASSHRGFDEERDILSLAHAFLVEATNSHVEQRLSAIRARYHHLCLIDRLPNEVLSLIFELATVDQEWECVIPEMKTPLTLLRVSKRWRSVAQSSPSLWTKIDAMCRYLAPLFLANSKGAPLDIELAAGLPFFGEKAYRERHARVYPAHVADIAKFLSPFLSHISRWRSLELVDIPQPTELIPLLLSSAPRLEMLVIQAEQAVLATSHAEGSSTMFLGSTPLLRHVNLHGFAPPLSSSLYTGLTTLTLSRINYPPHSIHQFLHNLSQCPLLAELDVARLYFELPERFEDLNSFVPSSPVVFQHLRRMALHGLEENAMRYLFASSRFPPFLNLTVHARPHADGFGSIFPPTIEFATSLPTAIASSLHIESSDNNTSFTLGGKVDHPNGVYWSEFVFRSIDRVGPEYAARLFPQVPQQLPVQFIEKLYMGSNAHVPLSAEPCIALLSGLPALKTLSLDHSSPLLLHALILTTESRICPLLHELSIANSEISSEKLVSLATSRTLFDADNNLPPDGTTHLRLLKLQGILSISLSKSDVWEPVNQALSKLPLVVEWEMADWETDQQIMEAEDEMEREREALRATASSGE
ncbi:hypothetical protein BOTBODRAFT_58384 [Botryobasidium botryosum FD-172 SS1]|uniref:F-box domain-containing protein n=1 Tax=Botryobasidium botryosum (strain FD-172 SS1) TaxID=930990 RepID=A0A067M2N2_BOTB1|nr:hypothetical protein BOTBODRAFT_58384 [Botryobasidium botryosum FD-172 SS1]